MILVSLLSLQDAAAHDPGLSSLTIRQRTKSLEATVTLAVCTTGDSHLVGELAGLGIDHIRTTAEPRFLGFECHKVLRNGLGQYDYFAYLEDDLRLAEAIAAASDENRGDEYATHQYHLIEFCKSKRKGNDLSTSLLAAYERRQRFSSFMSSACPSAMPMFRAPGNRCVVSKFRGAFAGFPPP